MPNITKVITIDITPERFLENCTDDELKEIDLLLQSDRYQQRINEKQIGFKKNENRSNHSVCQTEQIRATNDNETRQ